MKPKFSKTAIALINLVFLSVFFFSCQKEKSEGTASKQVDIYIAGTEFRGTKSIAKYWRNDSSINLTDGSKSAEARSIAVSGNDVYVAGWENNGTYDVAMYWKNGKPVLLTDGSKDANAYAITVSENDVYVAGIERSYTCNAPGGIGFVPVYWKNGKPVYVTDGSYDAYAFGIATSGNDVYVVGSEYNLTGYFGTYWKNSSPVRLSDYFTGVTANSVAVSGSDVYVAGTEYYSNYTAAKLWKNGIEVHLTDDWHSYAECVFVSDKDVYVCGNVGNIAKFWKNGSEVTVGSPGTSAFSIVVHGKDVYVAGAKMSGTHSVATYWKNGSAVNLTDGTSNAIAHAVFLKEH